MPAEFTMFNLLRYIFTPHRNTRITHTTRQQTRRWCVILLCLILGTSACLQTQNTETRSFEKAEIYYRKGNYDKALLGYSAFIHNHPNSPMVKMAKLRVRCIQREVRAMLDRQDMPKPVYRGNAIVATKKVSKPKTSTQDTPQKGSK